MYDQLVALHDVWLRLVKDGIVKNNDSEAFASIGSFFTDQHLDPTYEGALTVLFPSNNTDTNRW